MPDIQESVVDLLMDKVKDRSKEEQAAMAENIMFAQCLWDAIKSHKVPLRILKALEAKVPFESLSPADAILVARIAKEHKLAVARATLAAADAQEAANESESVEELTEPAPKPETKPKSRGKAA